MVELSILIVIIFVGNILSLVNDPMAHKGWNTMDINKIATVFSNSGLLCDGNNNDSNFALSPSFEYPQGSCKQYGTSVAVVVGAPFLQNLEDIRGINPDHLHYLDRTMDEGGADFWNEKHFVPYPELVNPTLASINTDPNSWHCLLDGGTGHYIDEGTDGLQVLGSSKFTLQPGEMNIIIFATFLGNTEQEIKKNALSAISLYKNNLVPLQVPSAPKVEAFASDRKVFLIWSTDSEKDPDFKSYKIYSSLDQGQTWGSESFTDFQGGVRYIPFAQYDKKDDIIGYYQSNPEYEWYYLDDNNWGQLLRFVVENNTIEGIDLSGYQLKNFNNGDTVNVYIDRTVLNEIKYRYYVAAYDTGNEISPLENFASHKPNECNNTVEVRPELPIAKENLNNIRVVPNPYILSTIWENGWDEHIIQFTGLSKIATIKIFNSSGELIKTFNKNDNSSILSWNLKNEYEQLVAPGVYFFHISSNIGTVLGKFYVVL
ncbi:MAG: T9SS type A sorting domain-containing protein [Ignavibacterium sp.]|uniref:T9SS type A sorting domain-containing protein n=1 Tax=Ignavibacterium sp. TaxID=2651167 RepID=UPI00404A568F